MSRTARVERVAADTKVLVELDIDGSGAADVETGVGFYDHMLCEFAKHAGFDLTIHSLGDLRVDVHHTVEDTAITLGQGLRQALNENGGESRRFGSSLVPLEDALAEVAVDVSGRPFLVHKEPSLMDTAVVGENFPTTLVRTVWRSIAHHGMLTLHVSVREGRDAHQICAAQFVAVGRALRDAVARMRG